MGENGFHLHLFFPSLGRGLLGSHRWLQGTEENGSIISCASASLVSLGQERLRSLNQGKKKERANLQQTELLKSGGFANHSLSHLWFFWPKSCIAQYLGGLSKSKQLILPSGSKFVLRSFGNTVQKYPDRLLVSFSSLSLSVERSPCLYYMCYKHRGPQVPCGVGAWEHTPVLALLSGSYSLHSVCSYRGFSPYPRISKCLRHQ